MNRAEKNRFSCKQVVFQGLSVPEPDGMLAGYAAIIQAYDLQVPMPDMLAMISSRHKRYQQDCWIVYTVRHQPAASLAAHLTFALRYEGVDLSVLKALFKVLKPGELETIILNEPTGKFSRRLWFFYEWLMDKRLNLPDTSVSNFVDALDGRLQYPGPATPSRRHRVRNNLPGVKDFCPLIRRTPKLEMLIETRLDEKVKALLGRVHPDILARAAAFLLLKDSKASYAIEGERVVHHRVERWGRAIGQAGQQRLTAEELMRLQEIVIEDRRFTNMGWRTEGGFVGVHDRGTNIPVPDHISARWQDVVTLINGLTETSHRLSGSDYDPVLSATLIAFGFVFIHPFEDGNGRIHRYLIHHVLAEMGFCPAGLVFPVSAAILEHIDTYRQTLEAYAKSRLLFMDWKPTLSGNVEVQNDTIDMYRYFDATRQAEFLYDCVRHTVQQILPEEVHYLACHDQMRVFVDMHFDMPDKLIETLIGFLRQGKGKLSKRARAREFNALTEEEVASLENRYADLFLSDGD